MQLLTYADLHLGKFRGKFDKVRAAIERDDFRSADLKKLSPTPYYRAKLDEASRLLVQFVRHGRQTACLALEIIPHHAYEKSRFLRGARVDEGQIEASAPSSAEQIAAEAQPVRYLHPGRGDFHLLDQPISFDDAQEAIYRQPPPMVLVGSAGSGKTALTLEKLRRVEGEALYVTQSPWLAQNARGLYYAHGYQAPAQETQFLSYREFLETLRVPAGREVRFSDFRDWFQRHRQQHRFTDAHPCFEEFRGVIGSQPEGVLSLEQYLALGPRQSIYEPEQRRAMHALFGKYREWLAENALFDSNLIAHEWQALARPQYDFVVVDEVQDLTNAQLALVLRTLKEAGRFMLCGDSNQIVHPNFFSWSAVKSLFWRDPDLAERQPLAVLGVNYRNTREVTRIANGVLKIKQARFGSVDRESNHLVKPASETDGEVRLLPDKDKIKRELDARTRGSTRFAVLVLRDEDKVAARAVFGTPLVFSVHEAKGLEYPNIILYRFISGQRAAYAEICQGVSKEDLARDELDYRRARDKHDRSLELWKFYVNALYVAITRAVEGLYLIESDLQHPLLRLLDIQGGEERLDIQRDQSSREEWEREAARLEQQGKQEQAEAIRDQVLRTQPVPWPVWNRELLLQTMRRTGNFTDISAKPRQLFQDMVAWHYQDDLLIVLLQARVGLPRLPGLDTEYRPTRLNSLRESLAARQSAPYAKKNFREILQQCDQYGVDHRTLTDATPLMLAAAAGNLPLLDALLERGADIQQRDLFGHSALSFALLRATRDPKYAEGPFDAVWERVAPPALDVQADGRLLRLVPQQGEYLLLQLMMAGLKTLASPRYHQQEGYEVRRMSGFSADYLSRGIQHFPASIWPERRRKRSYFNHVLARAEMASDYQPARRLWQRMRTGYYLPNPALQLRVPAEQGESQWQPIYQVLDLPMVEIGTGRVWGQLGHSYRILLKEARLEGPRV